MGRRGNDRPMGFEASCDAAEAVHKLFDNPEIVTRILDIPNYLETILINLTVALQVPSIARSVHTCEACTAHTRPT